MTDSLSEENAFSRLVLATVHNDIKLKTSALEFVGNLSKRSVAGILISDKWIELNNKNQAVAKDVGKLLYEKLG